MISGLRLLVVMAAALAAGSAAAATRSSTLVLGANGLVFVVNPDSDTVSRMVFDGDHVGTLTHEADVGDYPRTVALAGTFVFTADQDSNTVSRVAQADLGGLQQVNLGTGCNPYGIAPTPNGQTLVVSCQGTSEIVLLDTSLAIQARIPLQWSNARAIAVSSDGTKAYVTHFLTEEPNHDAHVSEVDLASRTVPRVLAVPPDLTTCETQNSGQGVLNLVSAIAIMPDDAPPEVAGQLWVGGTLQNNLSKGLFKRWSGFAEQEGSELFPWHTYEPFPELGGTRNVYKASFHDITRFGLFKLDIASGDVVGKIDVDEANNATDIEFSPTGRAAYVVDTMFNSYHIFNTARGQDGNPTTLFAAVSMNGPGGADPEAPCIAEPLRAVAGESPFRMSPQAEISILDPINPVTPDFVAQNTGVDFDAKRYMETDPHEAHMRRVPDGVGTAPMGVRVASDGATVFVNNYLSRNVVAVAGAAPQAGMVDGEPTFANLRCSGPPNQPCGTSNHCEGGTGFCNHPGGATCQEDADCTAQGAPGPCVLQSVCVPLLLGAPVETITGGIEADPLNAQLLDGKILFHTAARDASVSNSVGLGNYAPLFLNVGDAGNMMDVGGEMKPVPGAVVSTAHDASYVTCTACHADFGGQDGRTWDFSQFGASLRNTMDLRGRPGFAPGQCEGGTSDGAQCFFDAACGPGGFCRAQESMIPPNIIGAEDRARWFNPMLTVHWNGDRDEVEDFEHTYRSLLGAGDCDGIEDGNTCQGALIQRVADTSADPADVNPDLGPPNRNIPGPDTGMNVGIRLTNMADFVYSLIDFPENPNPETDETELGRLLFNDPAVKCASCHNGGPGAGRQFFTDKRPNPSFDVNAPGRPDANNPFLRHDVGTANVFDRTDPLAIAQENQTFQNPRTPIPGSRGSLGDYVTPVLNDLWNTRPYLHDGSAHNLLDVVRPCDTGDGGCFTAGAGRNLDDLHGTTDILTPQQLNALTAFQESLHLGTVVGNSQPHVAAGTLELKKMKVVFPKEKKDGTRKGSSKFVVKGTIEGGPGTTDPSAGVTLTLATPGGERMAIFTRALEMQGGGRSFRGASTEGGVVKVKLEQKGDGLTVTATGKKLDLSVLETGNDDFTVALEVGAKQFVKNRILAAKKHVRRLPKKSGRA
jgi:DNA-binding beta-propeller fold protein YncE